MRSNILDQRLPGSDGLKRQSNVVSDVKAEPTTIAQPQGRRQDAEPPLLLRVDEVAQLLGLSERSVWRMQSAGRLPSGVRLAGSIRWRRAEIEAWVDAGCPAINNPR